jgi:cytoskeletal protein RodZ
MQMESFGTYLKSAREAKKISLAEISRATKVRRVILDAIERDEGETLLPEVVVKGFVEAYARHVGLDPKEVLLKYSQLQEERSKSAEKEGSLREEKRKVSTKYMFAGGIGLIIIAALTFLFFSERGPQQGTQETLAKDLAAEQQQAVSTDEFQSPSAFSLVKETVPLLSHSADTKNTDEVVKETYSPVIEHILVIKASDTTWIQVQEGTSLPLDIILNPGESYSHKTSHPLAILIGNAGGVTLSFDGKDLGILGGVGEVVRLTLPSPEEG